MEEQKKKRLLHIALSVLGVMVVLSLLNIFLAKRLEQYLKTELVERTTEATDGFYNLSFEDLSIDLLTGELRIEGIILRPDSSVFNDWKAKDSLPQIYVNAEIEVIDFNGVNLIWNRNNTRLHFNTFEISKPDVKVFNSQYSARVKKQPKNTQSKTLYELVSPYIKLLTVETMNLDNASISYQIEDTDAPMLYALDDVTFHAYDFRLDENSSDSGKLLYCENFDFITNQKQTLLTNNDFRLGTDSILLSTKDSLIHIGNIMLSPQNEIWEKTKRRPGNTLEGSIESVDIKGLFFKRKDGLNSLSASSFLIYNSDITGTNLTSESARKKQVRRDSVARPVNADSLMQALSLYEIISPIFRNIAIGKIGIEKARLKYIVAMNDSLDTYKLDNFDFEAKGFVVDSASSWSGQSKYYEYISFEGSGIEGRINSMNQFIKVEKLAFSTEEKRFHIEGIGLDPIKPKQSRNYFSGHIETISLDGIGYSDNATAEKFHIHNIDLNYYMTPGNFINLKSPTLFVTGLNYQHRGNLDQMLKAQSFNMDGSEVKITQQKGSPEEAYIKFGKLELQDLGWNKNGYHIAEGNININRFQTTKNGKVFKQGDDSTSLLLKGFKADKDFKKYAFADLGFSTSNLSFPVDNGFYTLNIGKLRLKDKNLLLEKLHYVSTYPQMEFSYKHPKHSDWFDIQVGRLEMSNIDIPSYFNENTLRMQEATVTDMTLKNMKNQKIILPHRKSPMIYEGIQKAPVKLDIPLLNVKNFAVEYDELARDGDEPGKLIITDVNGKVTGVTNIVTAPQQFIRIDASARFMGSGPFQAIWLLPVDSLHDQFLVHAHLDHFDLTDLNRFITPLAKVNIESGSVVNFTFDMDASSKEGSIRMQLPYRELKIEMLKNKDGELHKNSFITFLANTVVRNNNPPHPDDPDSKLRESEMTIIRDPYHSTFNYLWQMLRPAMAESVGISEGTQKFGKGVMKIINGIKNFFKKDKEETKE